MADLKAVSASVANDEVGVVTTMYQPNDEPFTGLDGKPSTMTIVGPFSKRYRQAREEIQRRALRAGIRKLEQADLQASRVKQASAAVVAWSGWDEDGVESPCTSENVEKLLGHKDAECLLLQVESAIDGHARFFEKKSAA